LTTLSTHASARTPRLLAVLALFAALVLTGCTPSGNTALPAMRVLFIGNSYTFYNGGLDQVLHGLAPHTETASATVGGYTLADHLRDSSTMGKLQEGGWDAVVIQEQSQGPVWSFSRYLSSARTLTVKARRLGARPMLLQTWARPDSRGITAGALEAAFTKAGKSLQATVIPAGRAFDRSLSLHPQIVLNQNDGHPTPEGTYLAGCVAYATIFQVSPVGNSFTAGLDSQTAHILQQMAETATLHTPKAATASATSAP